jgi:hypothetical protein
MSDELAFCGISESDVYLFEMIYSVLIVFALEPQMGIQRVGGNRIAVADDQANQLGNFYDLVMQKYPHAADFEVMRATAKINAILSDRSFGSPGFDEWFWTNRGFQQHPDWDAIRVVAREFLLR